MKVIDLLNKIANGEEVPEKIKYYGCIYELKDRNYEYYNYKDNEGNYLEDEWFLTNILNDELEIIEDTPKEDIPTSKLYKNNKLQYDLTPKENKKIEKLDNTELYLTENQQRLLVNKINEIIDKVNKL